MGLISPTQVTDGTTADSSDINNPINTIANEFNGNIDNANIKTGAAIDGAKLGVGTVPNAQLAANVAWTSWTPTWSGLTISTSSVVAAYQQIGKVVHFRIKVVSANAFAVSADTSFTLPVNNASTQVSTDPIGRVQILDNSTGFFYPGQVWVGTSVNTGRIIVQDASATYLKAAALSSIIPMGWAVPDEIHVAGTYEAA